jgi:cytoskeletal protein CcmA (bactofilin family)
MVVDTNKDITGARNITLTGELDAGSLDVSGNADIDGTLEADAITINGTAIGSIYSVIAGSSSIVTTGALNSGSITSGFGAINNGSSNITTTGEIAGGLFKVGATTVIDSSRNLTNMGNVNGAAGIFGSLDISGSVDVDGTLEADAITLNGTALGSIYSPIAGSGSITTTGAINSGSINTGFGTINNGASAITTTGVGTFGSLDISGSVDVDGTMEADAITLNGTALGSLYLGISSKAADSNLLDGVDGANYLRSNTSDTFTGTLTLTGSLNASAIVFAESLQEDYDALSGTSPAPDADNAGYFSLSTSGNTTFSFGGVTSGRAVGFVLAVTAGGTHTLTWPNTVDWAGGTAPDAPASGASNLYAFVTRDGGSNWIGVLSAAAYA